MLNFFKESKYFIMAILGGAVPAIFWLWFWLKEEDDRKNESIGLIILTFITGSLLVFIAIWLEKYSLNFIKNNTTQIIVFGQQLKNS